MIQSRLQRRNAAHENEGGKENLLGSNPLAGSSPALATTEIAFVLFLYVSDKYKQTQMKSKEEVDQALDRAIDMQSNAFAKGSKYSGMSYEDGLREALDWVMENSDEDPTK